MDKLNERCKIILDTCMGNFSVTYGNNIWYRNKALCVGKFSECHKSLSKQFHNKQKYYATKSSKNLQKK